MANKQRIAKLTKRTVDAVNAGERRCIVWDRDLKGFGLRVETTGVKTFLVRYRVGGGRKAPRRQMSIGRFGAITVEQARTKARGILGDVADGKTARITKTKLRGKAVVRGGRGTAARTVGLLGGIFTFAVSRDFLGENPVRGIKRYPDKKSERFLSLDELHKLGSIFTLLEK